MKVLYKCQFISKCLLVAHCTCLYLSWMKFVFTFHSFFSFLFIYLSEKYQQI